MGVVVMQYENDGYPGAPRNESQQEPSRVDIPRQDERSRSSLRVVEPTQLERGDDEPPGDRSNELSVETTVEEPDAAGIREY